MRGSQPPSYYIRAYQHGTYIIEYDGRQLAATCRETLSWPDGPDKPGRPMAEHECMYHAKWGNTLVPNKCGDGTKNCATGRGRARDGRRSGRYRGSSHRFPASGPSPKTSPEILKTLHWIQNTLADEEGNTIYSNKDEMAEKRANLLPDVNGCQVTFVYATRGDWKETYHTRQQVNLGDLDPTSIKVDTATHDVIGPVSHVTVHTTDKVPTIRLTVNDRSWQPAMATVPSTDLLWELPALYAARFAKALREAITLCGGKPSSF